MAFKIINPGFSTSIQDMGRPGYFHLGIPQSGAMDRFALRVANMLVGNPEDAAGLEASFMGPKIEFKQEVSLAVTGAELPVMVDGEPKETWTSFTIKAGQTLSFGLLKSGVRIYIAMSGGISTPLYLNSRSTYLIGALGGFNGRPIQAKDVLPLAEASLVSEGRKVHSSLRRKLETPVLLRTLPGLYWYRLTESAGKAFFEDTWTVAFEADRMGYRFKGGRPLEFVKREQPFGAGADPSNIVDGCYSYGSIQVPGGTEPIVLHRDAVSGGGYFTLGAVISADMDSIGQLQPNTAVRFIKVDMDEAKVARIKRHSMLQKIRERLI